MKTSILRITELHSLRFTFWQFDLCKSMSLDARGRGTIAVKRQLPSKTAGSSKSRSHRDPLIRDFGKKPTHLLVEPFHVV